MKEMLFPKQSCNLRISLPSLKEFLIFLTCLVLFFLLTVWKVGLRNEHLIIGGVYTLLFLVSNSSRRLAVALLPFVIFGISYDWMRIYPNYEFNAVDVEGVYNLERSLFGIYINGEFLTPCEYFMGHHHAILDFLSGVFYLCWVPVPLAFGLWLYFKRKRKIYLHFALVFLLVNLIGFVGYYIYPAAPPWYALNYGFEPLLNTPGNVAGLARFDELLNITVFHSIYCRNANVFAAIPSLHAAYMVVTLFYAIKNKCQKGIILLFAIIMVGIWFTAVYTSHHYIIDVALGISCALIGILFFEKVLIRCTLFKRFIESYLKYISGH